MMLKNFGKPFERKKGILTKNKLVGTLESGNCENIKSKSNKNQITTKNSRY